MGAKRGERTGGVTLIEVLVVFGLVGLLMTVVTAVFQLSSRSSKESGERTERLVESSNLAEFIRAALTSSVRSGNTFHYQTTGSPNKDLAMSLISTEDNTGQRGWDAVQQAPLYQSYKIFFLDSTAGIIRRFQQPTTATTTGLPLSPVQLQTAISTAEFKDVVHGVTDFEIFDPQDSATTTSPTNPLGVRWVVVNAKDAPQRTEFVCRIPSM